MKQWSIVFDFTWRISLLLLIALFFITMAGSCQQPEVNTCPTAIEVETLPFYDEWCVENPLDPSDRIRICNPNSFLDPDSGCWSTIALPRWYKITTSEFGGEMTMNLTSDLCMYQWLDQPSGDTVNCGNMVCYYTVFNACPSQGGTVLSYPSNAIGTSQFECWDEFGGNPNFIVSSCWENGCCAWPSTTYCYPDPSPLSPYTPSQTSEGEPPWNFPTTGYSITFNLDPSTEYYFVIHPSSGACTPGANTYSFGCMTVEFEGPAILGLETPFEITGDCTPKFNRPLEEITYSYTGEKWYTITPSTTLSNGWVYFKHHNQVVSKYFNCHIISEKWDMLQNPMIIIGQR